MRYVSRPRALYAADDDEGVVYDDPGTTAHTIHAPEDDWIDTGLLNAAGDPLFRVRDRIRLGFTDDL